MGKTIQERADIAATMMRKMKITAPAAARRAIKAEGISYEPDVDRLSRDITSELGKRGARAKAARKRRGVKTPSLYAGPLQGEFKL